MQTKKIISFILTPLAILCILLFADLDPGNPNVRAHKKNLV